MKKIEAIIRPARVSHVCEALDKVGHPGMMLTEIEGHGKQKGMTKVLRGKEYHVEFMTKTKIDIVAKDEDVARIVQAIREAAFTGEVGDGKIFVSAMEDAIRIRTDEKGDTVL
ncbi:MAG: P-II family nitrogen regulator [Candidatus Omnitrophica bacterium]|nr:P-II family nitrogen regulator [Candidatus Omnitrophota bacterium]